MHDEGLQCGAVDVHVSRGLHAVLKPGASQTLHQLSSLETLENRLVQHRPWYVVLKDPFESVQILLDGFISFYGSK